MTKLFYDSLPLIVFFVLYYASNIFTATAGAMITSFAQTALLLAQGKRPDTTQIVSLLTIFILGGATLIFRNEMFIKWKPTAVYWVLASAFLGTQFLAKKSLIKHMLDKSVELPSKIWTFLSFMWSGFFFTMGILNLIIAYTFSTQIWVNFKLFGSLGLTLLFVIVQALFLSSHILVKSSEQPQNE